MFHNTNRFPNSRIKQAVKLFDIVPNSFPVFIFINKMNDVFLHNALQLSHDLNLKGDLNGILIPPNYKTNNGIYKTV